MPRGMTLLELITALALLSMLGVGAAAWIETSARAERSLGSAIRRLDAARAVLDAIADDLATGDFGPMAAGDRVMVSGRRLLIHSRGPAGPEEHGYALHGSTLVLSRRRERATATTSVLLPEVSSLEFTLNEEENLLHVVIRSDGHAVDRWIRVP